MSNTVTNISYANTFGEWMVATNALINENNLLAAGDYTKSSGTIYLNETTQNSLQANGTVIVQKELRVQGTGSSVTIDRGLTVGGQVYFTNSALGLTHTGQANLNGLVLVQGSGIGISVSNNAYVGGNTTIRFNTITNNVQANSSVNTQSLSVTGNSYTSYLVSNNQVLTTALSVTNDAVVSGVNIVPFSSAAFLKANSAYDSQNTTGTYANSAYTQANTATNNAAGASLYANGSFIQANAAFLRANTPDAIANSASLYANGAFTQANAVYTLANNILSGAQTISTLTLTGANLIALSARADFDSVYTNGKLSVGGDFVINGTTVYNSPTFILSSAAQNQTIYIGSYRTANGAANGTIANSYIRFNETNKLWEINDVNNSDIATTYSRILTANVINDSSTSTSTSNVPTSRLVTGLYIQANAAFLAANTPSHVANSAGTYANGAFTQANSAYNSQNTTGTYANTAFAFANSAGSYANSAFLKANAAYTQANTAANTFVGTTGSVSQSSGVVSFSSNNGVTVVATSANNLAVSTSQDLRTTASPTFAGLTLTTPLALSQGGTGATSASSALTALLPTGTTAGYVLTTGGPGNFYWSASGGGGGGATPGTTINSTRLSYTANGAAGYTGNSFTTPTWTTSTQLRAYINGVRQFESEYSANSTANTISFTTTPASGDAILIEVDGYYVNPYYANNIAYTPTGTITGNTIQIAIDTLEAGKATLSGATFTGVAAGLTLNSNVSNTAFATTAYVKNVLGSGNTFGISVTNGVVTTGSYADPSWITSIANTKISGLVTSAQIASIANTQITGVMTASQLANTAVTTGTYGGASAIPVITVDQQGRLTSAANVALNLSDYTANNSNAQFASVGVGTSADSANTGSIRATGTITAGFSDDNLKTKLGTIENSLDKVMTLSGFYYTPNETAVSLGYIMKKDVGVSAQEVEKVLPEIVVPAPIDNKYLTVQYEKMVPLLIEAIKELKLEIDALKGNKQ